MCLEDGCGVGECGKDKERAAGVMIIAPADHLHNGKQHRTPVGARRRLVSPEWLFSRPRTDTPRFCVEKTTQR